MSWYSLEAMEKVCAKCNDFRCSNYSEIDLKARDEANVQGWMNVQVDRKQMLQKTDAILHLLKLCDNKQIQTEQFV